MSINGKEKLVYPNQLQVVSTSDFGGIVKNSYYLGKYYLIEIQYNNDVLYLENIENFEHGQYVFFTLKNN